MGSVRRSVSNPTSVSIVGFAGCTSLGYSLEATLAAMAAGLSNFTSTVVPNEFGHPTPAALLIEGPVSRGQRLTELLHYSFEDLKRLLPPNSSVRIPACIGIASDLTEEEQQTIKRAVREQWHEGPCTWYPYGRASAFAALSVAIDYIASGAESLVLVGGIDSLCAPSTILSLVRKSRVLSPYSEGTVPGEAAVFALLARSEDPVVSPEKSLRLDAVVVDRAQTPFTNAEVISADALTHIFRRLRIGGAKRVGRVIGAHSGEGYFAREFAHAYLREVEIMPEPLSYQIIADSVGDVGAAAGMVGLAFGADQMTENASDSADRVLVYSESDMGEVGAAILEGTNLYERSPSIDASPWEK